MHERSFWGLEQDELDAVARAFTHMAELRAVRVLDELAEGSRKLSLRLIIEGGSVPDAASKALVHLKEKRKGVRPGVPAEITEAFEDFARLLLRRVRKRSAARPGAPASLAAPASPAPAKVARRRRPSRPSSPRATSPARWVRAASSTWTP